eukprot:5865357-Prymnesium_polylepis.1
MPAKAKAVSTTPSTVAQSRKVAAAPAVASALSTEWEQFANELERTFVALYTVCALLSQREVRTTLAAVR